MIKQFRDALVFLAMLFLCTAVHAESESKKNEAAEQMFNIQMNLALNNDPQGQYKVAEMYEQGVGIPQNFRMAYLWYTKSANQHYAPAINRLANWENEQKEDEALAAKRTEEQKRRHTETEAAAKATRERAEEQKRRQAEAAAVAAATRERTEEQKRRQTEAAAKATRERAEEQKRRQAEAAAKTAKAAESTPVAKEKQPETDQSKEKVKVTAEKNAEKDETKFRTNPCKTPTAKFTSTCQ